MREVDALAWHRTNVRLYMTCTCGLLPFLCPSSRLALVRRPGAGAALWTEEALAARCAVV